MFPEKPVWHEKAKLAERVLSAKQSADLAELRKLSQIDVIKMHKRISVQSKRRCFQAKSKEVLGEYWVPRHGPRCTHHVNPDFVRVPLQDCGPHVIEEQYREIEEKQVEKLAKLIKELGLIRYNLNRKIPSDYASLEDMLAKLGKEKQHSLGRASLHIRMIPEESNVMKTAELFRQVLTLPTVDEFIVSEVEGIREVFPEYVNDGHVYVNLTQIYVPKAAKYKNTLKRAFFLFRKARALLKKIYLDNERLFKEQDKEKG
jgi:hypothetical protein